jgi:putative effector of murein hydrolase
MEDEMAQYAAYGRLGPDAMESVPGWICIRRVAIPAQGGRLAHYAECVAMAQDMATAKVMAASPDMADALLIAAAALQDAIAVANQTGWTVSKNSAVAALAAVNAALDRIA